MSEDGTVDQVVKSVSVAETNNGSEFYCVGYNDVTKIEIVQKKGSMDWVPYVRVWKGESVSSEHCQHNVLSVHYEATP